MVAFKRKIFTISEGHYTGPKDLDEVPGYFRTIGKAALAGGGIGTTIGGLGRLGSEFGLVKDDTPILGSMGNDSYINNALTGAKYGAIAGVALKLFLNHLHNPMTSVKFSEVDKLIRREFGVYRVSGITVGDTINKRDSIDEKFGFNDRNVTDYKINIAIQDDKVTMYTFGMTKEELDKTSKILDYYCKKFAGMDYHSTPINASVNSYSVNIVFTNYKAITDFIMELSNGLLTRINLLDNKSIVSGRINDIYGGSLDSAVNNSEKSFTDHDVMINGFSDRIPLFNKVDKLKILTEAAKAARTGFNYGGAGASISFACMQLIKSSFGRAITKVITMSPVSKSKRGDMDNLALESLLKYGCKNCKEGVHYTVGEKNAKTNISIVGGNLIITTAKSGEDADKLDKVWKQNRTKISRIENNGVIIYYHEITEKGFLHYVVNKIISLKVKPNIFI